MSYYYYLLVIDIYRIKIWFLFSFGLQQHKERDVQNQSSYSPQSSFRRTLTKAMLPLSLDGLFLEVWNNSVVLTLSFGPALEQIPSELRFFQLILAAASQPRLPPLAVRRSSRFPRYELQPV